MGSGLHLFEQAHILDGDAGLVRKRSAELDLALAERSGRRAYQHEDTDDATLTKQRDAYSRAHAEEPGGVVELRIGQHVGDVDCASLQDGAPEQGRTIRPWVVAIEVIDLLLRETESSNDGINIPIPPADERDVRLAELGGHVSERVQHGLQIELRAADDAEELVRGRLISQRLRQFARARLHLLKQAGVFERDAGLVGKALREGDHSLGKLSWSIALQHQRSKRALAAEKRQDQHRAQAGGRRDIAQRTARLHVHIGELHWLAPFDDLAAARRLSRDVHPANALNNGVLKSPRLLEPERAVVRMVPEDEAEVGTGKHDGAGDDGFEHGLEVQRRANGTTDFAQRREVAVARLHLLKETRGVDGDHSLVSESLQELDLSLREWTFVHATDQDGADGNIPLQQRCSECGSVTVLPCKSGPSRERFLLCLQICDLNDNTIDYVPTRNPIPADWAHRAERQLRRSAMAGDGLEAAALKLQDLRISDIDQLGGASRNRLQYAADIRRGTRNCMQDLVGGRLLLTRF